MLEKFQKSEKNSEVGGWVKPQLGFLFLQYCVFCAAFSLYMFQKKMDKGVGGFCLDNPSFSRIFLFL